MNSRTHIKTQKFAIFLNNHLNKNMMQMKSIINTREYRGAAHSL